MSKKLEVQLSFLTMFKGLASTALLIGGGFGVLFSTEPKIVMISGICLFYSYMLGLDARLSRHEEILDVILKPKGTNESNGQQTT